MRLVPARLRPILRSGVDVRSAPPPPGPGFRASGGWLAAPNSGRHPDRFAAPGGDRQPGRFPLRGYGHHLVRTVLPGYIVTTIFLVAGVMLVLIAAGLGPVLILNRVVASGRNLAQPC